MNQLNINSSFKNTYEVFLKDKKASTFCIQTPVAVQPQYEKKSAAKWLLGLASGITAGGALLLTIGIGSIKFKNFNNIAKALETKIQTIRLGKSDGFTGIVNSIKEHLYLATNKGLATVIEFTSSLTANKENKGILPWFTKKTTQLYRDLAIQAVKRNYERLDQRFAKLEQRLEQSLELIQKSEQKALKINVPVNSRKIHATDSLFVELNLNQVQGFKEDRVTLIRAKIGKIREQLKTLIDDFDKRSEITENGINSRIEGAPQSAAKALEDGSTIATIPFKRELKKTLMGQKDLISRTIEDNYFRVQVLLNDSIKMLDQTNLLKEVGLAKNVESSLELLEHYKFAETSEFSEHVATNRLAYKNQLCEALDYMIKASEKSPNKDSIIKKLEKAKAILTKDNKGLLQEVRELLKCNDINPPDIKEGQNLLKMADEETYYRIKNELNWFASDLTKSTKYEADRLFENLQDIKLGAAPIAILSLILPAPYMAYKLATTDNAKERKNTALKQGIPLAGGIGAWAFGSMRKLYNTPQTLLLSLATSALLAGLGSYFAKDKEQPKKA